MDKSWMSMNRLSREYEAGVESFIQFALQSAKDSNRIPCPCANCGNLKKTDEKTIRAHLVCPGMDLTYKIWIFHGEISTSASVDDETENTRQAYEHDDSEDPIDMVHDAYETYEDNPSQFIKLLEDARKPLYPDHRTFTKLSAIVKLYNLKAKYGWSDTSFNELLELLGKMLPNNNQLPSSLYNAKKCLSTLGMSYEKIHACPNDCILYRKMHEKANDCPTCGLSRWKKIGRTNKLNVGVPAKVLWYFPPVPRFLRMFRNKELARDLTWHADKRKIDGQLRHPADAPAWKLVDEKWPEFALEHRHLRLALSADGINPHRQMNSTYSCWPVLLVTYNLPPWLCMKRKFVMLSMLISGPKQPGNDIDVYLSPLIEDLKELWDTGVEAYDAYREESFILKAVLLWTINDFPAYGNLSGCSVKGYQACPICGEKTYAHMLKHGRKVSYRGTRRFLPRSHPYRRQKKAFDGQQEFDDAPIPLTGHEVYERVKNINCSWGKKDKNNVKDDDGISRRKRNAKGKAKEDGESSGNAKEAAQKDDGKSCWKKRSIFFDLTYWEHLHVRHVLDVMHIEKNVCESVIGTLLNIPGKTKDGVAARQDLMEMGVRTELAPEVVGNRTYLPPACYTLSRAEKQSLCKSLHGMKVPTGYSSNVASLVSLKELKLVGLKSHDYHTLMQQLLPVAIRGILPKHVRYTITRLCLFFNMLCDKVIDVSKLDEIQRNIVTTLCLLEKEFPPSFFDIMIHLVVHLVREVKLCGPVWYRWMYPFERYMKILKGYVRNHNRPEGCIAECYIAEEAVEVCADYLSNIHTIGIPSSKFEANQTKALSRGERHPISDQEWEQAHRYVLTNDFEIDPYIEEHKTLLRRMNPGKARSAKWLQDEHNKTFIRWIYERLGTTSAHSSSEASSQASHGHQISTKLKWMAHGPSKIVTKFQSYLINGVTYNTKGRDHLRTIQNSGVSLVAKTMQISSAKDKNPVVTDMIFYGVIREIWELDYITFQVVVFKCDWVENKNGMRVDDLGFTLVNLNRIGHKLDSFILGLQAKQVFYVEDPQDPIWSVVLSCPNRGYVEFFNDAEVEEIALSYQLFAKDFPTMNLNDEHDETEPPCVREGYDGIWLNN